MSTSPRRSLLETSRLYQRIRNVRLRLERPGELIPVEFPKYDQRIVLEALHNCVAHQDYTRCERVLVIAPEDYVRQDDAHYRQLILDYLRQFGEARRVDLRELLLGKLPEVLDDAQKENKIHNLLSSMRREGLIDRLAREPTLAGAG